MNDHTKTVPGAMRSTQNEIRLKDVLRTIWDHKALALLFVFGCTALSGVAAHFFPKQYEATATVSPASDNSSNASGALGSLSNNLAAIAGVSMSSDPKKVESIAVLKSEALTERYIRDNNLLPILYAGKWDATQGRWKVSDPDKIPTLWKANQFFKKYVAKIVTDSKTGLVTVEVTWKDPKLAAQWANGLVKSANDFERAGALRESERNIAYLTGEAVKTDVLGIKQAIYSLMESELDKEMLAKGNDEYSFKLIDPATAPERPSSPITLVWMLVTLFGSLSIAAFSAFCVVAWRTD
jgi:uncharacterized protein involved in exopolysaccharide biosynthesis